MNKNGEENHGRLGWLGVSSSLNEVHVTELDLNGVFPDWFRRIFACFSTNTYWCSCCQELVQPVNKLLVGHLVYSLCFPGFPLWRTDQLPQTVLTWTMCDLPKSHLEYINCAHMGISTFEHASAACIHSVRHVHSCDRGIGAKLPPISLLGELCFASHISPRATLLEYQFIPALDLFLF